MTSISAKSLKSRSAQTGIVIHALFLFLFMQGCSDVETLVRNKAEATIDSHQIVIKPCRNSYTRTIMDTETNRHHVFGCGEGVKVEIKNEALTVNGKSYGTLGQGDSVEVKNDRVFINKKEAAAVAMK